MSTLAEKAAANAAKLNPANAAEKSRTATRRVPFTAPVRKLEVPPIPGYYLYWTLGTPSEIARAQQAGFEFVHPSEVPTNDISLGGDGLKSGSTDLGERVSIVAGEETGSDGQAVRLYLMKQKWEYYEEDQKLLADRNASIAQALTTQFKTGTVGGRAQGETGEDMEQRYVNPRMSKLPDMFNPHRKRRP